MNTRNRLKIGHIHPLYVVLFSFIFLIVFGSMLLLLPMSAKSDIEIIDAVFTATSAVCVTGLTVLDTAKDFTIFGKTVILMLIQFGGFGIMTLSLGLISLLGKNLSVKWSFTIKGFYSDSGKVPITYILIRVIKYTFVFEAVSAILLFSQFKNEYPFFEAAGHSIFHSISAFCNAGFSTFSDNLVSYQSNLAVILIISCTIILGGIGFIVLNELSTLRFKLFRKKRKIKSLISLHTKFVLIMTGFLLLFGTVVLYFLEQNNTLKNMNLLASIANSFFQSVTCRTAGFNTIQISELKESSQLIMIFLMFIGGSPGSIAGGIKTTTIFIVTLFLVSKIQNKNEVSIFNRTLDEETIEKSLLLFVVAVLLISFSSLIMLISQTSSQSGQFLPILFETVSAFGTVGLSTGITPSLSGAEKCVLIFVMLSGRLGLLTIIMMFSIRRSKSLCSYPREQIMVG